MGGNDYPSGKGPVSTDTDTFDVASSESQERMMENANIMRHMKTSQESVRPSESPAPSAIMVSKEVDITHHSRAGRPCNGLPQYTTKTVHDPE